MTSQPPAGSPPLSPRALALRGALTALLLVAYLGGLFVFGTGRLFYISMSFPSGPPRLYWAMAAPLGEPPQVLDLDLEAGEGFAFWQEHGNGWRNDLEGGPVRYRLEVVHPGGAITGLGGGPPEDRVAAPKRNYLANWAAPVAGHYQVRLGAVSEAPARSLQVVLHAPDVQPPSLPLVLGLILVALGLVLATLAYFVRAVWSALQRRAAAS